MATIHVSTIDAVKDFGSVLAKVRQGTEVIIEDDRSAVAVLRPAHDVPFRLLSESLRIAEERGFHLTPDSDFASDLEGVISSHRELLHALPEWE